MRTNRSQVLIGDKMKIELSPKIIARNLSMIIGFLLLAHVVVVFVTLLSGHDSIHGLIPLFHFGGESNIPTLYSSVALLICSMLLFLIAVNHKKNGSPYFYWMGLALLFLLLSIDETASIHEKSGAPVRALLKTSGLLYYGWMIPYGIAAVVVAALYIRFLLRLPRKTMFLFILSGVIFVVGAVGFEMLGGWRHEAQGINNALYYLFVTFEELFEMFGIVIFIYALLAYIGDVFGDLMFTIKNDTP